MCMGGNGGSKGRPASLALANDRWRWLMVSDNVYVLSQCGSYFLLDKPKSVLHEMSGPIVIT